MQGRISSFQTLGTLEGPGIRFVAFLQGCPLRCAYCHNPETWDPRGGTFYTTDEIIAKAVRYKTYFGSAGGITLSGGEPFLQSAFAAELLKAAKTQGIHTAICTAGTANLDEARTVLRYTDLVIADLKFTTESSYIQYCKGSLNTTLDFLHLTEKMNIPLWVRQVIVPTINDTPADTIAFCKMAGQFSNLKKLELLPFRKFCLEKYENMGLPFPLRDIPEANHAVMEPLEAIVRQMQITDECR